MPARISRSNVSNTKPKNAKNKSKQRSLNAYASAQRQVPEDKIRKHRLGEIEDDGPRQKRRRQESDDEEDEDEEEPPRKRPAQRRVKGQDDDLEYGSDSEGNEWTLGGIAEDDDESDLDSDEAFGESDEERFEGFTFRGSTASKSKKKGKKAPKRQDEDGDIDLEEQQQSEDDSGDSQDEEGLGLGDEAVDLAAMLDDNENDEAGGEADADDESGSGSEEESQESESDEEESEDEDIDEEGAARLQDFLEGIDVKSSKKKPDAPQRSVATLDDFMEDSGLAPEKSKSKKKQKPTALAAPLPKRQQEKIDREIAAQKAKEQLDRWRDTVARRIEKPSSDSFAHTKTKSPMDGEEYIRKWKEEGGNI